MNQDLAKFIYEFLENLQSLILPIISGRKLFGADEEINLLEECANDLKIIAENALRIESKKSLGNIRLFIEVHQRLDICNENLYGL